MTSPFHCPRANILLVDDDRQLVAELTELLGAAGYACRSANDAESALANLGEQTPDLLIVDIDLGGESGLALCGRVRREAGLADLPVIVLSGAELPNIVMRAKSAGGTYYLRKPHDADVLLELVEKALWMPHVVKSHLVG